MVKDLSRAEGVEVSPVSILEQAGRVVNCWLRGAEGTDPTHEGALRINSKQIAIVATSLSPDQKVVSVLVNFEWEIVGVLDDSQAKQLLIHQFLDSVSNDSVGDSVLDKAIIPSMTFPESRGLIKVDVPVQFLDNTSSMADEEGGALATEVVEVADFNRMIDVARQGTAAKVSTVSQNDHSGSAFLGLATGKFDAVASKIRANAMAVPTDLLVMDSQTVDDTPVHELAIELDTGSIDAEVLAVLRELEEVTE